MNVDVSKMSVEELKALVAKAEKIRELRRFEEGLRQAISEYQSRDSQVIRF